jgi:hypothetical protein
MTPRKLHRIVGDDPVLSNLWDRTRPLRELQEIYFQCVPTNLRNVSRVGAINDGVLKLFADTGAAATRLRLHVPDLLLGFSSKGWQFSAIRVAVQVRTDSRMARPPTPKVVDGEGQNALARLAEQLPDSPLKDAVIRLKQSVQSVPVPGTRTRRA